MRLAVLDLGSTSFHLVVVDADLDGVLETVVRERVRVGLGTALGSDRAISPEQARLALEAASRLCEIAGRAGADRTIVAATAALRGARNGAAVLADIEAVTGHPVRLLDGDEEARLAFLGMTAAVGIPSGGDVLVADLGGGSFELARGGIGGIGATASLDLGVERFAALHGAGGRPSTPTMRRVADAVRATLDGVSIAGEPVEVVAGGGWARVVGKLVAGSRWDAIPPSINRLEVTASELDEVVAHVARLPVERRCDLPGVGTSRADLLPVAALVVRGLAEWVPEGRVVMSDWGLREGIALDAIGAVSVPCDRSTLRRRSVERLAQAFHRGDQHADHVTMLARQLAGGLGGRLGLDGMAVELLEYAARLHDIGASVSPEGHHRHGAYVVNQARLRGFTPSEVAMVSAMIRHHARARCVRLPATPFPDGALGPGPAAATAVLRLADALDRPRCGTVEVANISFEPGRCVVTLCGDEGGASAWAAADRVDLLVEQLGMPVVVVSNVPTALGA